MPPATLTTSVRPERMQEAGRRRRSPAEVADHQQRPVRRQLPGRAPRTPTSARAPRRAPGRPRIRWPRGRRRAAGRPGSSRRRRSASATSMVGIGGSGVHRRLQADGDGVGGGGPRPRSARRSTSSGGRCSVGRSTSSSGIASTVAARVASRSRAPSRLRATPRGIAADPVDVGGGELDQALEEGALGRIVGAHPGRLQELVGLEEVAAPRMRRGRR